MSTTHVTVFDAAESKPTVGERIARRLARFFRLDDEPAARAGLAPAEDVPVPAEPVLRIVKTEPESDTLPSSFRWRRHPLLRNQAPSHLPGNEREARHDAVRGLFAARAGALECAASHFARAAECDRIDLSGIPGFWQLDRSAMMTAVEAYERAGRIRDASALNARIRTMYRPRVLTPLPENVTHLPQAPTKVSSNS
jgi:hypothetical protein